MRNKVQFGQLLFASLLGIAGGVYIFNPVYFIDYSRKELEKESKTKNIQKTIGEN